MGILQVPIVMGHNAFFGVNHLSSARADTNAARYENPKSIIEMIDIAIEQGAGGIMMSTHERAAPIARLIRESGELRDTFRIYPLLPYAQKYVTRANEVGMLSLLRESMSGSSISQKLAMAWQGSKGFLAKDVNGMIAALVRLELLPFKGLNTPAVFLHDVLTDLALGLGMRDVFSFYVDEMKRTQGAEGAFATKNLPLLLQRFSEWGIPPPVVLTHFNRVGFQMNPSRLACENAAKQYPVEIMAMGTLASGHIPPDEAFDYLSGVSNIKSVVVGASTPQQINETFSAIKRNMVSLHSEKLGSSRDQATWSEHGAAEQ
jgi:hypothetical protein